MDQFRGLVLRGQEVSGEDSLCFGGSNDEGIYFEQESDRISIILERFILYWVQSDQKEDSYIGGYLVVFEWQRRDFINRGFFFFLFGEVFCFDNWFCVYQGFFY